MSWLFRKKETEKDAVVTIKIIGMLSGRYVSVMKEVKILTGATVLEALKAMKKQGMIDKEVFALVKDLRPPLQMLVNGSRVEGPKLNKTPLKNGDEVSILTATSGG